MDADDAVDTVDDLFDEVGVDGTYSGPGGVGLADVVAVIWRPRADRMRDGQEVGAGFGIGKRALFVLVRRAQVADPQPLGVFCLDGPAGTPEFYQIGEDAPVDHDSRGIVWRCAAERLTGPAI